MFLLILNLSKTETHPKPPVIEHKSKTIFIDWPNERFNNIATAGRIAGPGGLRLQFAWSIAKSPLKGCSTRFGALTSPFIHCNDDFTCPPMSSLIWTPSPITGVSETKQVNK